MNQGVVREFYYRKDQLQFGRGAERFVCECGRYYDWIRGCTHCKSDRMRTLMARKVAEKKANGIPIKSWQKRGQKAYISRLANMYFTDTEKFLIAIEKLEIKDGNRKRVNQVKRKIVQKTKSF